MDHDREADSIRDAMARLRRDADANAEVVFSRAREMTDWRHYVRKYPKTSLLTAAALGYLIVPSKGSKAPRPMQPMLASMLGKESAATAGMTGTGGWDPLLSTVAKFAVKNGVPWLSQEFMRWWKQQSLQGREHNGVAHESHRPDAY